MSLNINKKDVKKENKRIKINEIKNKGYRKFNKAKVEHFYMKKIFKNQCIP